MRKAHQGRQWLLAPDGHMVGLALGYDFCHEHESGASCIRRLLNIPVTATPRGIPDRTMTAPPAASNVYYKEYELKSRDKRFKQTATAALLVVAQGLERLLETHDSPQALARACDVGFFWDFAADKDKQARTGGALNDLEVAWSSEDGFAIHARGEHLERLRSLAALLQSGQLVMADPSACGFLRSSMALIDVLAISEETKVSVLAQDLAQIKLLAAAEASGIESLLKSKGLGWYALEPAWVDDSQQSLQFFLNPRDQQRNAHGWFTLEELQEWAEGSGPVLSHNLIEATVTATNPDWRYDLGVGLDAAGMPQRRHTVFVWTDVARTQPGVRLRLSPEATGPLTSGDYSLADVQQYVDQGKAIRLAQKSSASAVSA